MGKSCKDIAQSLVDCMKDSPCVKAGGDIRECMKEHPQDVSNRDIGHECQELRNAYFLCKRGGLDMRTRIRGPRVY